MLNAEAVSSPLQAQEKLRLYSMVFEHTTDGIMITDTDNNIVAVNRAFSEITGYTLDEVLGKNPKILNSGRQSQAFYQDLWQCVNTRGRWQGEIWNRRKDGALYAEWLSISAVCNEQGDITQHIAIFSDITERSLAVDQVRHLAHHDPLTGLPNRALLYDRINQMLLQARREERPVAALFVDLDYFKDVNDLFGHAAGDLMLQTVAGRLKGCVREADTVARLGGDEFVVVSSLQQAGDAAGVAEKIAAALARPFIIHERELYISASVGISLSPGDGDDVETLIVNADLAMYQAKQEGGGGYQFFCESSARAGDEQEQRTGKAAVKHIPAFVNKRLLVAAGQN